MLGRRRKSHCLHEVNRQGRGVQVQPSPWRNGLSDQANSAGAFHSNPISPHTRIKFCGCRHSPIESWLGCHGGEFFPWPSRYRRMHSQGCRRMRTRVYCETRGTRKKQNKGKRLGSRIHPLDFGQLLGHVQSIG